VSVWVCRLPAWGHRSSAVRQSHRAG
jgi:hypothetical protein